jgi:hypothetical protein
MFALCLVSSVFCCSNCSCLEAYGKLNSGMKELLVILLHGGKIIGENWSPPWQHHICVLCLKPDVINQATIGHNCMSDNGVRSMCKCGQ